MTRRIAIAHRLIELQNDAAELIAAEPTDPGAPLPAQHCAAVAANHAESVRLKRELAAILRRQSARRDAHAA